MINRIIVIIGISFLFLGTQLIAQEAFSSISSKPGSFSRMGFGARGKGMGNALTAVTTGNIVGYYNPALSVFQQGNSFQTSYSFLSLDRSLNFVNFTRRFELGWKNPDGTRRSKPRSVAGVSLGLINAGVDNFAERDNQGVKVGDLSPFENQFFMGVGLRTSEKLAIGFTAKFYYSKFYEEVTSTSFAFDIGAIYIINQNITIGAALIDVNAKYKWDTTELYQQEGTNTTDEFPIRKKVGISYKFIEQRILASLEFEGLDGETNFLRFGAEYNIFENLFLRAGLDNLNISNTDFPARPTFGFSYTHKLNSFVAGIDYAFVVEPYSSSDQHIIGINLNF
jgi:hypothetical protein